VQVVKLQSDRDVLIQKLVGEMDESCKVAQDAASLRDHSQRSNDIVLKILQQVVQCTYFVKEYCSKRCFGMYECTSRGSKKAKNDYTGGRLLRDMTSLVEKDTNDYIDNLQQLRRCLGEHASVSAAVLVHRVCGQVQAIGRVIPSFFSGLPSIIVVQRISKS
jgi:hypothetical protein